MNLNRKQGICITVSKTGSTALFIATNQLNSILLLVLRYHFRQAVFSAAAQRLPHYRISSKREQNCAPSLDPGDPGKPGRHWSRLVAYVSFLREVLYSSISPG